MDPGMRKDNPTVPKTRQIQKWFKPVVCVTRLARCRYSGNTVNRISWYRIQQAPMLVCTPILIKMQKFISTIGTSKAI